MRDKTVLLTHGWHRAWLPSAAECWPESVCRRHSIAGSPMYEHHIYNGVDTTMTHVCFCLH